LPRKKRRTYDEQLVTPEELDAALDEGLQRAFPDAPDGAMYRSIDFLGDPDDPTDVATWVLIESVPGDDPDARRVVILTRRAETPRAQTIEKVPGSKSVWVGVAILLGFALIMAGATFALSKVPNRIGAPSVWQLPWVFVLIPALITALAVRFDNSWLGPYWSFLELVTGMSTVFESRGRLPMKRAIARRLAYPTAAGFLTVWINRDVGTAGVAVIGATAAGLLLWPIVFAGLPLGVARNDWLLVPIYSGFVVAFAACAVLGRFFFEYARAQGNGDALVYFREEGVSWLVTAIIATVAVSFWGGGIGKLRERKAKRDEQGYEELAERGEDEPPAG
jgi:hypothetical protein